MFVFRFTTTSYRISCMLYTATQRNVHILIFHRIRIGGEGDAINQNINIAEYFICLFSVALT